METFEEIIDAVRSLSPAERADLFGRFRNLGLEPTDSEVAQTSRYESEPFTQALSELFHQAKHRALGH